MKSQKKEHSENYCSKGKSIKMKRKNIAWDLGFVGCSREYQGEQLK